MNCLSALELSAGVAFFVGSGGKTTLIGTLGEEARERGKRVILATTTHFLPFPGIETVSSARMEDVDRALDRDGIACVAAPAQGRAGAERKLGPSPLSLGDLAAAADLVLVEADGSKHLPLKAHAAHEPVVPAVPGPWQSRTVLIVGASGFDRPIGAAVHRAGLFCERTDAAADDIAAPGLVARLVATEAHEGVVRPDAIVVSQVRDEKDGERAGSFARSLAAWDARVPVYLFDSGRHLTRLV